MKKTLNELLHMKQYKSVNLKIGSKQGSSFWYCGSGNLNYVIPAIKRHRVSLLRQSKRLLKGYEYRLENLDAIYEKTLQERLNSKKEIKNLDNYIKNLNQKKESEQRRLPKLIQSVSQDIEVHLLDREVVEVIKGISPDEAPCYIIYVKGNEKGRYWTIKEYERAWKEY